MEDFTQSSSSDMNEISHQRKIGILADGSIATVRRISKSGFPILEIFDPLNYSHKKIRYANEEK